MGRTRKPEALRARPEDRVGARGKAPEARASGKRRGFLARLFLGRGAQQDKQKARRKRRGGGLFYWGFVLSIWGSIGLVGIVAWHAAQLPPIDQLAVPKRPPNIAILAEDGSLLANRGDTGGPAVHIGELPPYLPKAFIAIEDRRFYDHWGVDVVGIARALSRNVTGGAVQGGSTITQQLAKNLFLTQERTVSRKIQEAILAIWLEQRFSKDQILELYMNRVYFGSGAYGVEAAAQRYFGRTARSVSLAESAVLAGLMVAPSRLAPNRNPRGAAERATLVIGAMAREGFISDAMAKVALSSPAESVRHAGAGSVNYAADYVMDQLDETIGAIDSDVVVRTTIVPALQAAGEKALSEELDRNGVRMGVSQGALVALSPTGEIRALIGGRNYAESQFNRAVSARRQPGSAFKPFVYLTALERGLTPLDTKEDAPLNIKGWRPENSNREYQGTVTLTRALAQSLNTVSVRLTLEAGPKKVAATAQRLGIQSHLQANASIALGTSEVTPLELVSAYAPFANGGVRVQPHVIVRIETANGKLLYQRKGSSFGRVIEPAHVGMMNVMLQETLLTGTGRRAELKGWQAAGKTGTSQEYRDGWFVGYTSQIVAGVWLGNDDSSPTKRISGGNLPADIWARFVREGLRGAPETPLPGVAEWRAAPAPPMAAVSVRTPAPEAQGLASRPAQHQSSAGTGPVPAAASRSGDLLPPAEIGAARGAQPQRERGLLERLLGG
ncbi:MAG: PBP1A family penicillin-binding protein [Beijerinckiaceae bacterium]|nr:PBP1A family penicillin-binding protein [Beijerinckiaceae bacterium]